MTDRTETEAKVLLIFHGYAFLFCLTIIAINPFFLVRGTIWTQPKIFCVAGVVVVHLWMLWQAQLPLTLTAKWRQQASAWIIFLSFGLISTLLSPFPGRSFWGHGITADGLLYWFLLAGFVLTNSLILQQYPKLFRWQLRGILVGATLVSLSMYPQLINWKIDYTLHSGHLWPGTEHVLATAVYRNHQPIGLYSHRGFAGFTLAIASVLSMVALKNGWLAARTVLPLTILVTVTLSLAKVRGAMVAMLAGWLWLALKAPQRKSAQRLVIALSLIGLLSFGWATIERRVVDAEIYAATPLELVLKHFASDRLYLWRKARKGILERPWFGWGFGGYSMADANYLCPKDSHLIALEDYYAYCQVDVDEIIKVAAELTKAHNLILDEYVSLGLFGASSYFILLSLYTLNIAKTNLTLLAVVVTYFTYVLTWYDCGQLSHLGWWVLSLQSLNYGRQ